MSGFSLDGVILLFPTVGTRRSQGIGGWGRGQRCRGGGLSAASGPSDSSLGAGGGASGAAPAAEAASGLAADPRGRRGRAGGSADAATGAAPGSWRAAALVVSSKCLCGSGGGGGLKLKLQTERWSRVYLFGDSLDSPGSGFGGGSLGLLLGVCTLQILMKPAMSMMSAMPISSTAHQ